jgi:hypothetical protein
MLRLITECQAHGTTNATINRRLALLRRAYHLAKLRLDPARLDSTDCFLEEASPRGKHLSPQAFAAIASQLDDGRRALFEFCYLTGKRWGPTWRPSPSRSSNGGERMNFGPPGSRSRSEPASAPSWRRSWRHSTASTAIAR